MSDVVGRAREEAQEALAFTEENPHAAVVPVLARHVLALAAECERLEKSNEGIWLRDKQDAEIRAEKAEAECERLRGDLTRERLRISAFVTEHPEHERFFPDDGADFSQPVKTPEEER